MSETMRGGVARPLAQSPRAGVRVPRRVASQVIALLASALLVAGCANFEPKLPQADASLPVDWPVPATLAPGQATTTGLVVADLGWAEFFTDARLRHLIGVALMNNRDLRIATLNVERARAQYRIRGADRLPAVSLDASDSRSGGNNPPPNQLYSVGVGVTAYELDFFGRVGNLSQAALQQFLAQQENRRAMQIALMAEIAGTWLSLQADMESKRIAEATLASQQSSYDLALKRQELGAASGLVVSQARTTVESARADVARYAGLVATGTNALRLLAGTTVAESDLPTVFNLAVSGLRPLPAQLPSQVLLRRPDVLQAEFALRAANANIGAARAAFFPIITLTGSVGFASTDLGNLFSGSSGVWSFMPGITLPIFQRDRLQGNFEVAVTDRDIALARYEKAIQNGFREVADALALTQTLAERRAAQEALFSAAERVHQLARARYDQGLDSYLVVLDAQRTLYSAQQGLVSAQLAEQVNRVTLYKVLGGGWKEQGG